MGRRIAFYTITITETMGAEKHPSSAMFVLLGKNRRQSCKAGGKMPFQRPAGKCPFNCLRESALSVSCADSSPRGGAKGWEQLRRQLPQRGSQGEAREAVLPFYHSVTKGAYLHISGRESAKVFDLLEIGYLQSKISANAYTVAVKPGFFDIAFHELSVI
jgi:hypothetical protein